MKKIFTNYGITTVISLFLLTVAAQGVAAQTAFAVSATNQLVRFNVATPGTVTAVGAITGLQTGENVVGIDFRPATGQLFGLGSTSRLYTINKATGAATPIAVLSTALSGASFGMDFNPVVDRLRVISNTGQNLRINPTNGAVIVDTPLNGATTGADAGGYINNFNGAAATTLFDISSATDTLYTQNPPNAGTLVTVGALGVDITDVNGFDIVPGSGTAFLSGTVGAATNLYAVNLTTGAATLVGAIGGGTNPYRGLAVEIGSTANYAVFGVTTANNLLRFNSARPNTLLATTPITGLQAGENVLGIDFRPATGQLFALGSTSRLYTINTATGAATFVAVLSTALSGTDFGVDFNPVPDRLRVVSNTGQNLRINPADGVAIVDMPLNPGTPQVVGAAYSNNFAGTTTTTLYDIDSAADALFIQNPPNAGTLVSVGSLGINVTSEAGFDITAGNNTALAALQLMGATSSALYRIDLATGSAAVIGPIGGGSVIRDIAIGRSTASGSATATLDFNGDGRTDYSVFRTTNNFWFISPRADGAFFGVPFGLSDVDILTPGDYDGDGRTDIAVWRTTEGMFYVNRSSDQGVTFFRWGTLNDEPVARDYDGDGRTDFAVVRRTGGAMIWYIVNSSNGSIRIEQFGLSGDVAAPGDYDGDGRFDLAVHRGAAGAQATYFVQASTAGFSATQWGLGGDLVVPGDYDGDGRTDLAVVRAGTPYTWFVLRSSDNALQAQNFGSKPIFTTQGDYDGDGKTDFSIWDPISGNFRYSSSAVAGSTPQYRFGLNGDYPVANVFTH